MTKKEDTPTQLPKAVRSTLADAQEVSSDTTIAQTSAKSKENNAAVQKNVRYQLAEQDELAKLRTEQQQLTKQRSALKEERSVWLNSAEVQRIEAKKKALGVFSAEGKAYRDSAEYQDYLAKRKEYNSRLAALEERDSALTEQMKAALQSSVSSWRSRPAGRQRRTTSGRRAGILRTRRRHWTP